MDRFSKIDGQRKKISRGTETIGRLVGGVAIIKFVLQVTSSPVSTWLTVGLKAYQTLFHPLVDYSVGLLVKVVGFELLPWAKDLIVLHIVIASAVTRAAVRLAGEIEKTEGETHRSGMSLWLVSFLVSLAWPLSVTGFFASQALHLAPPLPVPQDPKWIDMPKEERKRFFTLGALAARELLYVLAIAAVAILLNAAGEL